MLKGLILNKYYGYELSYTINHLEQIHKSVGFKEISIGAFVFNPSEKKLKNPFLRKLYRSLTANIFITPVYYVYAKKK